MRPFFILSGVVSLLLLGCAERGLYEPSEFAQSFDPGKVVETMAGIFWKDEEKMAHNKSVGLQSTSTKHAYFRVFHFEPRKTTNDLGELVIKFKESATSELQAEGFEMKLRDDKANDFSIYYHSAKQSGSLHIFTTKTDDNGMRIIGVIHETPIDG